MKVYITKYALAQGILEKEGEISSISNDIIWIKGEDGVLDSLYHKPFWHTDINEAKAQAESLRIKKIKVIKKELNKLENMSF